MKTVFLLLALLLINPLVARAAEVPQTLMPIDPRCSVSLGNSTVDYGRLSRGQLDWNGARYTPGKRVLTLSVVCPFAQSIKLALQGERAANGELRYGENGRLKLRISEALLDGQPTQLRNITRGEQPEQAAMWLKADSRFEASRNGAPAKGKSFSAKLELEPELSMDAATVQRSTEFAANFSVDMIQ